MGKYVYVTIANVGGEYVKVDNIFIGGETGGGYLRGNFYLHGIIESARTKTQKGVFRSYEVKEIYYENFPIICENQGEYLVDLVTGNKYKNFSSDGIGRYSPNLTLIPEVEVPISEVAKQLSRLSKEDVSRYRNAMCKLEEGIAISYNNYLISEKNNKQKLSEEEDFIHQFKNKYR